MNCCDEFDSRGYLFHLATSSECEDVVVLALLLSDVHVVA